MEIITDYKNKTRLKWDRLLSFECFNLSSENKNNESISSLLDKELGTIVNSDLFRRMEDKTQVFAYRGEGKARTRLTHSIEAMHIALEIGKKVSSELIEAFNNKLEETKLLNDYNKTQFLTSLLKEKESLQYLPQVLRNAMLIHDIGNPPFGHKGEDLISDWLIKNINNFQIDTNTHEFSKIGTVYHKSKESVPITLRQAIDVAGDNALNNHFRDIWHFEGNAQSLRVVSKLMYPSESGITVATLSAIMKYTTLFTDIKRANGLNYRKKTGYFYSEKELVDNIKAIVGTEKRNPTAFLVEGSDDVAYALCDLDDCLKNGFITFEELFDHIYQFYCIKNDASDSILNSNKKEDVQKHERQRILKAKRKQIITTIANIYLPNFAGFQLAADASDDDIKAAIMSLASPVKTQNYIDTIVESRVKYFNDLKKDESSKIKVPNIIVYREKTYKALFNGEFYKFHHWSCDGKYEQLKDYLRRTMIDSICECFSYYYNDLIYNVADKLSLADGSYCDFLFDSIHTLMKLKVYKSDKVRENEVTEYKIINTLMTKLIKAIFNADVKDELKDETYDQFEVYCSLRYSKVSNNEIELEKSNSISAYVYYHLRCLIDNIAGMSDGHALRIYKKIQGIVEE